MYVVVRIFLLFENFQTRLIVIFFALDLGNESETKGNKNDTGLKFFKPKKDMNHNLYMYICSLYFFEN